jgi:hypothetical protein
MLNSKQKKLFFIVGPTGSGTNIIQKIMNTFFDFCNLKESKTSDEKSTSLWTPVRKSGDFTHLEKFIEENWLSEFFVECTSDSVFCLSQLSNKFPESNYIFLVRDPKEIVISHLNKFQGAYDILERHYHIENLMMEKDDLVLNREQYYSKFTLKQILKQAQSQKKFQYGFTIRYESLINSFHSQISEIEKYFGIMANFENAYSVMKKPLQNQSHISKIKDLTDMQAISMIKTACRIWNY